MQVFMSDRIQLGDVLARLLDYTGKAKLTVSTFSCGEEFLMRLFRLRKKGMVTEATLYADMKAAEKTARINSMMKSVYDKVFLCANHSKVMIIEGEQLTVCVLASQNQTRGNRMESYVIVHSEQVKDLVLDAFNQMKVAGK